MNLADIAEALRSTTEDLKRDNDIAELKDKFDRANAQWAKWSARCEDEEFLQGPADTSNWRYRIACARVVSASFRRSQIGAELVRARSQS